jgi:hypothetical protein
LKLFFKVNNGTINLRTVKQLGLTLAPGLIAIADEVKAARVHQVSLWCGAQAIVGKSP